MKLEDLYYLGFDITSSQFEQQMEEPDGKGYFNYDAELLEDVQLSQLEDEDELEPNGDDDHQFILKLNFAAKSESFVGEEKDKAVYTAHISGTLRFTFSLNKDSDIEAEVDHLQSLLDQEQWFFLNFAHIAAKTGLENVLKYTVGQNSKFPSYRI